MQLGYLKTRVNPAIFKPVNPSLRTGKNPGLRVQFWVTSVGIMQYKIASGVLFWAHR